MFDPVSRFLVAYQHWLYFPVMALARVNLYIQSLVLLFSSERVDYKAAEIIGMGAFFTNLTLLICQLPSEERLMFFLVSHGVSGLLHV